ncbi:CLIP4 protein, partial [Certhia familiaris]|nr:CLIP4 protein [Certhia familiaris]
MTIEDLPEPSFEGDSLIERERFLFPNSETTVTFSVAAAPMPSDCEFSFFDPNDAACQEILFDPKTSVSELFAILRQWVPQVQQNIDIIGNEIIKRGCNVNDRDGLTDMTLLHYTCKSGAHGIGDVETAVKFATQLIDLGADSSLRSRWTNMNALHYAAYFDVPELIRVILKNAKPKDVDATCSDFDFGTALHIAAFNLCTGAVKCLLEHGANPAFRNDKGQIPADVVPDPVDMPLEMADAAASAKEIKQILLDAVPLACDISKAMIPTYDHVTGRAMLLSLGLKLGDRVVIAGQKVGTLRFCGTTEFASGQWAGVELDEPEGKNNGSVGKVQYFKCPPKRGIFAPLSKISKASDHKKSSIRSSSVRSSPLVKSKKVDVTHITSRVNSGLNMAKKDSASENNFLTANRGKTLPAKDDLPWMFYNKKSPKTLFCSLSFLTRSKSSVLRRSWSSSTAAASEGPVKLHEGSQVLLTSSNEMGTIRYIGPTDFAPGIWLGLELRSAKGKNDGSVGEKRYFTCKQNHGVLVRPSRVTYRIPSGSSGRIATFSSSSVDGPYSTGKAVLMTSGSCRREQREFLRVCSHHALNDTSSSSHAMVSTHPTTQSPHSMGRGCRQSAVSHLQGSGVAGDPCHLTFIYLTKGSVAQTPGQTREDKKVLLQRTHIITLWTQLTEWAHNFHGSVTGRNGY